jgi:hypothetical protein
MVSVKGFAKALWCACTSALLLFAGGCGSATEFYRNVDEHIAAGRYEEAIQEVRKNHSSYGDKSTVLYKLDMGMLFHYAGIPDSSNAYFFDAEKEMEDLFTKSISLSALSVVLNDNVLPYEGEDFEKVMVNVFLALNFAERGDYEGALVEARKVDLKLREYARQYEGKNTYQEDAFVRYLAGVLYESDGEINDAFISYRKAYEAYRTYEKEYGTQTPTFLLDDLVRTAALLRFDDERLAYESLGGKVHDTSPARRTGSVVVLVYSGKGPIKLEQRPTVSIPDSAGTLHTFQVALPKFVARTVARRTYDIEVVSPRDTSRLEANVAEDITAIAQKSLEDRLALVYLKSGGRALLKFLAAEKVKSGLKNDGKSKTRNLLESLAVDLLVGATEQADLRTWRTLPAAIHLARIHLTPGTYTLTVASSDGKYHLADRSVTVKPGRATFVIVDDVR